MSYRRRAINRHYKFLCHLSDALGEIKDCLSSIERDLSGKRDDLRESIYNRITAGESIVCQESEIAEYICLVEWRKLTLDTMATNLKLIQEGAKQSAKVGHWYKTIDECAKGNVLETSVDQLRSWDSNELVRTSLGSFKILAKVIWYPGWSDQPLAKTYQQEFPWLCRSYSWIIDDLASHSDICWSWRGLSRKQPLRNDQGEVRVKELITSVESGILCHEPMSVD